MDYQDSVERSAEYLRLALPLMSKQAAALSPVSYAVWYDYVSGRNAALKARIDELTRDGRPLDDDATKELFPTRPRPASTPCWGKRGKCSTPSRA